MLLIKQDRRHRQMVLRTYFGELQQMMPSVDRRDKVLGDDLCLYTLGLLKWGGYILVGSRATVNCTYYPPKFHRSSELTTSNAQYLSFMYPVSTIEARTIRFEFTTTSTTSKRTTCSFGTRSSTLSDTVFQDPPYIASRTQVHSCDDNEQALVHEHLADTHPPQYRHTLNMPRLRKEIKSP